MPATLNLTDEYLNPSVNSVSVILNFPLVTVMSSMSRGCNLTFVLMEMDGGLESTLMEVLLFSP